jgi:hypothetical protein
VSRLRQLWLAAWPYLLIWAGLYALTSAIWPRWSYTFGVPAWACCLIAITCGTAVFIRPRLGWQARLRRELIALTAGRSGGVWLNRDGHQVFRVSSRRRYWGWTIWQVPEDDAREVLDTTAEGGEGLLFMTGWFIMPLFLHVVRHDDVVLVNETAGTARALPGAPGFFRRVWRSNRLASQVGLGTTEATKTQLLELITLLQDSERLDADEAGDDGEA